MSNNDYFTVAYKILSYLKYCYENSVDPDPNILVGATFNVKDKQFYRTLQMLSDDGYVKGVRFTDTTTGMVVSALFDARITSDGLQYLAENSMMAKAYKIFKEFREWAPFV